MNVLEPDEYLPFPPDSPPWFPPENTEPPVFHHYLFGSTEAAAQDNLEDALYVHRAMYVYDFARNTGKGKLSAETARTQLAEGDKTSTRAWGAAPTFWPALWQQFPIPLAAAGLRASRASELSCGWTLACFKPGLYSPGAEASLSDAAALADCLLVVAETFDARQGVRTAPFLLRRLKSSPTAFAPLALNNLAAIIMLAEEITRTETATDAQAASVLGLRLAVHAAAHIFHTLVLAAERSKVKTKTTQETFARLESMAKKAFGGLENQEAWRARLRSALAGGGYTTEESVAPAPWPTSAAPWAEETLETLLLQTGDPPEAAMPILLVASRLASRALENGL